MGWREVRGILIAAVVFTVAVIVFGLLLGCAGAGNRTATGAGSGAALGAIYGAATGGLIAGGKGAAGGALLGGLAGALIGGSIGAQEAANDLREPQPLLWLKGQKVRVVDASDSYYGIEIVRPIVEDQLRRRGALIVAYGRDAYGYGISSTWGYDQAPPAFDGFTAEVSTIYRSGTVIVVIRIIDKEAIVRAMAEGRQYVDSYYQSYYYYDREVEGFRNAAFRAVKALH